MKFAKFWLWPTAHGTPRTTVTFDYGWKFKLGDRATAVPPLEVASLDSSFVPNPMASTATASRGRRLGEWAQRTAAVRALVRRQAA